MADTTILIPINLSANAFTPVYQVPANRRLVANINICNTTSSDASYFLSFVASGDSTTSPTYFVEYNKTLKAATGISESVNLRTGELLPAGATIVAKSSITGVCVTLTGALGN